MPRIIKNLRKRMLSAARRQISERGYHGVTVRSVASECGVGVGTVYNYFESKEVLVANVLLEDWMGYLDVMAQLPTDKPRERIFGIYKALTDFAEANRALFSDREARRLSSEGFPARHAMLKEQIAGFVIPVAGGDDFLASFVADILISHAAVGTDFDKLYKLLEKAMN